MLQHPSTLVGVLRRVKEYMQHNTVVNAYHVYLYVALSAHVKVLLTRSSPEARLFGTSSDARICETSGARLSPIVW